MRRIALFFLALVGMPAMLSAQTETAGTYVEPADPVGWEAVGDGPQLSWASRDVHYAKSSVPQITLRQDTVVRAWRGERVSAQAVIYTKATLPSVEVYMAADNANTVADENYARARFVNYVLCDEKRGCGANPMTSPAYLVPDIIDLNTPKRIEARTTRPVWVTIEVPRDAPAGERTLRLVVNDKANNQVIGTLRLRLNVVDRTLPEVKDYAFHTDFWQQPYAVARYNNVPRWSQRHFDLLRPYLQLLARGGQKVATTILFYEPWGVQSNDKFDAMVKTTKRKNGKWRYDYSVFDHYVELCDSCGINQQINCYSMIPWDMSFRYYDEAKKQDIDLKVKTSDAGYRELWVPFLKSFAEHLKKKGWFDKTCIAMDERGLEDMKRALAIVREAVPDMKMSLAGAHHKELVGEIYDYSLGFPGVFTPEELAERNRRGWISTEYTCCPDLTPNLETYNAPSDAAYLPLYCIANGLGGHLHWSWMNWTDQPLQDSRFKLFPAGDTYLIYPGPRSSLRWERFIEGVQQAEKCRILSKAYRDGGNDKAYEKLQQALAKFKSGELNYKDTSARLVNSLEQLLNAE